MKFTKKHDEMLKQVPWIFIKAKNIKTDDLIEDKEQKVADDIVVLLVKSVFTKNSYIILFTDLKNVWFEELFSDEIKQRFQESELKISIDKDNFFEYILFLSEFFLRQQLDLCVESIRNFGLIDLTWKFKCKSITSTSPPSSPNLNSTLKSDSSSNSTSDLKSSSTSSIIDASTILYNHIILPQMMVICSFNQLINSSSSSLSFSDNKDNSKNNSKNNNKSDPNKEIEKVNLLNILGDSNILNLLNFSTKNFINSQASTTTNNSEKIEPEKIISSNTWHRAKHPMNKATITTAIFWQFAWSKRQGLEEKKNDAKKILKQFKVWVLFFFGMLILIVNHAVFSSHGSCSGNVGDNGSAHIWTMVQPCQQFIEGIKTGGYIDDFWINMN
ncbi:20416_t:CDS:2, partial [Entrophospora sp. SA101]